MQEAIGKTRILVVDDEEMIVEVIAEALEAAGYEVKTAHNGRAAKTLLDDSSSHFDVVISDLRMPQMDGVTLLRHSKVAHPRTKFIAMTGHSETNPDRVIELGADEFVSKPFVMDQFTELINRVCVSIPQLGSGDDGFEVI